MKILSISYGKDSLACIGACEKLGWKIDRIIHAEVWATKNISADLPPMLAFKRKADAKIYERTGIKVEHISAKQTYQDIFYRFNKRKEHIYGFPILRGQWCTSELKQQVMANFINLWEVR